MTFKVRNLLVLLLATTLISGCLWMPARSASEGHVYPTTSLVTAAITCEIPNAAKDKDTPFWVKILAIPQALAYTVAVELPFSLATDTLLLPFDLLQAKTEPRKSVKYYCEDMSTDSSKHRQQPKEHPANPD